MARIYDTLLAAASQEEIEVGVTRQQEKRSLDGNCKSPICTAVGTDGKTKRGYKGQNSEARSTKDERQRCLPLDMSKSSITDKNRTGQ